MRKPLNPACGAVHALAVWTGGVPHFGEAGLQEYLQLKNYSDLYYIHWRMHTKTTSIGKRIPLVLCMAGLRDQLTAG